MDGLDVGEARHMLQETFDSRRDEVESVLFLDPVTPSDSDPHRPCCCDPCEAQNVCDPSSKLTESIRSRWDWPILEPGAKASRRVETLRV